MGLLFIDFVRSLNKCFQEDLVFGASQKITEKNDDEFEKIIFKTLNWKTVEELSATSNVTLEAVN